MNNKLSIYFNNNSHHSDYQTMPNRFEGLDPTLSMRDALAEALVPVATSDEEKRNLEKFLAGTFFVPQEATKNIGGLIEKIPDKEDREKLWSLYSKIIKGGL